MNANPSAPILLPRRSPTKPFEVYVYNVMVNYRRFHIMNIIRQPMTWLASTINNFRSPVVHSAGRVAGNDLQQQSVPEKAINVRAYQEMDKLCEGGSITEFDNDMLTLMKNAYAQVNKQK